MAASVWVMSPLAHPHTTKKGQKTQNVQNETSGTTTKLRVCCFFRSYFISFRYFFIFAFFCCCIGLHIIINVWLVLLLVCPCWQPFRSRFFVARFFEFPSGMKYTTLSLFVFVSQSHAVKITHVHTCVCVGCFLRTQQHQRKI